MLVFLTLKMTTVSFQFMILLLKLKIMYMKKSQIVKMTNYSLQKSTLMRPRQLMGVLGEEKGVVEEDKVEEEVEQEVEEEDGEKQRKPMYSVRKKIMLQSSHNQM